MNINDAKNLQSGDVIFNIFQEELVVNSVHYDEKNNKCNIICVNTGLFLESYSNNEIYKDLNDLTVQEYQFLLWVRKNKNALLSIDNESIDVVRQAYSDGYYAGWSDKPRCSGPKCKGKDNALD